MAGAAIFVLLAPLALCLVLVARWRRRSGGRNAVAALAAALLALIWYLVLGWQLFALERSPALPAPASRHDVAT